MNKKLEPKVYCIKSKTSNKVYVGSCCNYLSLRKAQHKYGYNRYLQGHEMRNITTSIEIYIDDPDPEYIVLENLEDRAEQKIREQYWIDNLKEKGLDVVNMNNPVYSYDHYKKKQRDRYQKNPEKQKKKALDYYYKNRHEILARAAEKTRKAREEKETLKKLI